MSTTSKLSFTSNDDDGFTTELSSASTVTPRIEAGADKPHPVATHQKRRTEYHFVGGFIIQTILVIALVCLTLIVIESDKLRFSSYIDIGALVFLWAFLATGVFLNHICMDILGIMLFIIYCLLSFAMAAIYGIFGLSDHCEDPEEHFKEVCDHVKSDNNDALYLTAFWGVCFVAYGLFAFTCVVSACTNRKPKGRSVVVQPKQLPQQPSLRSGKHKRSHQHRRSSSKDSSKSGKTVTSHASSKSAAPSLSARSIASVNNPETSSMQSYVPPMNQGPSQYTPSSYRSTCPYAASECSTTACPYYRGPRQAGTQALQPYHPHGAAAPVVDPKRSIVIDLPEAQHLPQGGNNGGGGYIDIQRIVVNLPQAYGQGNQRPHIAHQRPIVSVPQTPGQESSVSMGTGQPRDHKENVYVTSVTPVTKR